MKGKKLLEDLQRLTQEQLEGEVYMEGCDCEGIYGSLEIDTVDGYIYLLRGGADVKYEPPKEKTNEEMFTPEERRLLP